MALSKERQNFIASIAKLVQKYAPQYGIKVYSPIIAQAILESGWGESKLAATYHNYFGLKCGSKWTGKSVNMKTQEEYTAGTKTTITDNFRAFDSMEEGVKGYFEFIQLTRYQNLKGITDPKKYLETIKADGYATSSTYVENNMNLVVQYKLTQYDQKGENVMKYSADAVVSLVTSWIGKNEKDGSYKTIIDIYNSYTGKFPRNTKMDYSWAWCACTWSALAIKLGYTAIMPIEISCGYLIERAKEMGIWTEDDKHVPHVGDACLYYWNDGANYASTDCTGWPDHVGTVVSVNKAAGTFEVVEGNKDDAVGKRVMKVNGRYIRGFICPKYDSGSSITTPTAKKTVSELAYEVLAGKWGTGDARKNALTNAGYSYAEVQAKVNEICSGKTSSPKKSVAVVAKEVIAGEWGNGDERKSRLKAAGYDASEVQKEVNRQLKGTSSPGKSVTQVAKEVIQGKWGNGDTRRKKLEAAGYNFSQVQAKVNELLKG